MFTMKRAAVCIGVNRAGSMKPLQAAVKGARDFESWAKSQQCKTELIIDDANTQVTVKDIFRAVRGFVNDGTYNQLIVYFSGHGILLAPGAEFWLLSDAPDDPNEAVNLYRSIEDARNSGIPHIIFVSDACRSSVKGPPLSGVTGGVIFPSRSIVPQRSEIDVFYATRPGDPAYEVEESKATGRYRGIFTQCLLEAVDSPRRAWVESVTEGASSLNVITSRQLKPHLESTVPVDAAAVDIKLRQKPELRVETGLPNYFAVIDVATLEQERDVLSREAPRPPPTIDTALSALNTMHFREGGGAAAPDDTRIAEQSGLRADIGRLADMRGRGRFETKTGFTLHGAIVEKAHALRWYADPPFVESNNPDAENIRLHPKETAAEQHPSTFVLQFKSGSGVALAVLPGFIGAIVVERDRVVSVNYVPSDQTARYAEYSARSKQIEEMKAFAAVAARNGRFFLENEKADQFAARIRQAKGIDPTLGLYAAYAYAQAGEYDDVYSVFDYMVQDEMELPVPFDVVMLATRYEGNKREAHKARFAPFVPMLSQGWALMAAGDHLFQPIHNRLRPHLVPSLWTTLDSEGVQIAAQAVLAGEVK